MSPILQHISADVYKEKEQIPLPRESQPRTTTPKTGIKKLGYLLDPRKDRALTLQDVHMSTSSSNHTPIKNYLEVSRKLSGLKTTTASHNSPDFSLITTKDLVRLAMSKHKPKKSTKKERAQNCSSVPRSLRKSLSLRFSPLKAGADKRDEMSANYSGAMGESSAISRNSGPSTTDKSAKLRRIRLIYNDSPQIDMSRVARSSMHVPSPADQQLWPSSFSPNLSNSALVWPRSPSGNIVVASTKVKGQPVKTENRQGEKAKRGKKVDDEKSNKKCSVSNIDGLSKDSKSTLRQRIKRQDKKTPLGRKTPSSENLKAVSVSYSRMGSQHTIAQDILDRVKSPIFGDDDIDEIQEGASEYSQGRKSKGPKVREESFKELKSWVNDLHKQEEKSASKHDTPQNKNTAETIKVAQETMLERLRDALTSEEYVRREDFERLLREKREIEEELYATQQENEKLKTIFTEIQNGTIQIGNYKENQPTERQKELLTLKRRETLVKNVLNLIWKAGVEIENLQNEEDNHEPQPLDSSGQDPSMYKENIESYAQFMENQGHVNVKAMNAKDMNIPYEKNYDMSFKDLTPKSNCISLENSQHNDSNWVYSVHERGSEVISSAKAMSAIRESEDESSILLSAAKKHLDTKSTANSTPLLPQDPRSLQRLKKKGKLRLDLTGLGGNITIVPKEKLNLDPNAVDRINNYILTDGGQSLGFHEEFMSKLEEFSLSWRQAALNERNY